MTSPLARPAVEIHARKRIPLGVRVKVLKRQCAPENVQQVEEKGGKLKGKCARLLLHAKCALSGEPLIETGVEWDHIIPLAFGGTNEADNIQAIAPQSHGSKTKKDQKDIKKSRRLRGLTGQQARRARNGPKLKSNRKLGSDKFKRKFNGEVTER